VSGANVVVLCLGATTFAMWYFISLYLQEVLGYDALEAGLCFLPMTVAIIITAQLASRLTSRLGAGVVLGAGLAILTLGMLGLSRISADGSYVADVLGPALVAAAGFGLSFVPGTIAATTGVSRPEAGLASGLVNTARQVGGSIGLALLATIATQRTVDVAASLPRAAALTEGFQRAFLVGAGFAATGALVSLVVLARVGLQAAAAARAAEAAPRTDVG
jgi:predicted MFS family arabinose efflux permease